MKKIISCTLAASITGTCFTAVNPKGIQAVENDSALNNSADNNNVKVEIENIEEIKKNESIEGDGIDSQEPSDETSKEETAEDEISGGENSSDDEVVEDGDKTEGDSVPEDSESNTEGSNDNDDVNNDSSEDNIEDEENKEDSSVSDDETNSDDAIQEEPSGETSDEILEEITEEEIAQEEIQEPIEMEEELEADEDYAAEATGKLEVDMNFAIPLGNSDNLDIQVELLKEGDSVGIIDLSKVKTDSDEDISESEEDKDSNEETLLEKIFKKSKGVKSDSKLSYKIEKFNSLRQPIEDNKKDNVADDEDDTEKDDAENDKKNDNDSIYYIKITFENLEKGSYGLNVSGSGYTKVSVEDIEIKDFSKRVKIGNYNSGYNAAFLGGDVNSDGRIDMKDYDLVFKKIESKRTKSDIKNYDLNRDGKIDIADLSVIYENIGQTQEKTEVEDTDKIIDINDIKLYKNENLYINGTDEDKVLEDILIKDNSIVELGLKDGGEPSKENPITLSFNLSSSMESSKKRSGDAGIEMEQIVIKAPEESEEENEDAGAPSKGFITLFDKDGEEHKVTFDRSKMRSNSNDIVIDLGGQIAVKQISINVTANRGNKKISQISKIEFLNNVYKELPKPNMNIPKIKTLETSTEMHDERITISWEAEENVTSYEVKYDKLNENGQTIKSKKLQTNKTNLNILDKEIQPYDFYRVSIQSLNGDWSSGYEEKTSDHKGYDGKPDNVDKDYNPIENYYKGNKGSVTEVQVIPLRAPEVPRNLTTVQGYRSFTVAWENHRQARDFDIYYRKVGDVNWIKDNEKDENKKGIIVSEYSPQVTKPNKDKLHRGHSYTVNDLEDNTTYEVRVTATNHLGTSRMSETYLAATTSIQEPSVPQYKLINKQTSENEVGTEHIIDVRNKLDENGWASSDNALKYDSKYAVVDGNYLTSLKVNDWDMGAVYGSNRGPEITFDKEYEIGKIILTKTFEQGFSGWFNKVKVTYWDDKENKEELITQSIQTKTSNGQQYHVVKLPQAINAKKVKVETAGGSWQTISELMFYEYDSIEDDIKELYTDSLRLEIKDNITQNDIDNLYERLNTKDSASDEYHPDREMLLKELDNAQKLFNDMELSSKITSLDASIRTDNVGPSLGMENSYQSLGSVARPNALNAESKENIVVYMGSTDANTKVDIVFIQNYGQPGAYISKVTTISPG
ncbi:MAG: dockerin type I domain-containing protein, partial [Clostridium sp.]|nr:dockerin type I domain-containing protein [Clostridium sp.]